MDSTSIIMQIPSIIIKGGHGHTCMRVRTHGDPYKSSQTAKLKSLSIFLLIQYMLVNYYFNLTLCMGFKKFKPYKTNMILILNVQRFHLVQIKSVGLYQTILTAYEINNNNNKLIF